VDALNSFSCSCRPGYSGLFCQTNIDECASNPCQNGATCFDAINSFSCLCIPGYSGVLCQTNIDECASNPCQNGASCLDSVDSFSCSCPRGYSGSLCQLDINESSPALLPASCPSLSVCNNTFGSFHCLSYILPSTLNFTSPNVVKLPSSFPHFSLLSTRGSFEFTVQLNYSSLDDPNLFKLFFARSLNGPLIACQNQTFSVSTNVC
jgi:hypothetical protein